MPVRFANPLRHAMAAATAMLAFGQILPAPAQQPGPPLEAANFDPSDVYFQGYLAVRASEQLESAQDYLGALQKLQRAHELFATVRKYYPQWKPDMVARRSEKTLETIAQTRPKAEQAARENRNAVAELEGGVHASGRTIDPAEDVMPLTPGILEVDPLATRRLNDAEAEVERLKKLTSESNAPTQNLSRRELQTRLRAAENNVKSLRSSLAAAPMQKEMQSLNKRIQSLEQERTAMAMALSQSKSSHKQALDRIASLETELANLNRDLKAERKIANSVVSGQRRQLDALEKQLKTKNTELAQANERINGLIRQLDESRAAFSELRDERDTLLQERDQMSALLKLNEAGRIQDLIEQNMSLAKSLREANEKVDRMNRESNADKDAITDALRDLAIAKSQINRLHQEKQAQQQRLNELENRLRNEERALAGGGASADPAEVAILRDIIKRQLRVQERRRQARDLLVEAAKDLGAQDERLAKAIELFDGQEIALTPEEQKLLDNRQVDGEFMSPYARDRETVNLATAELNRDISVFERTAEKSYLAGRLLPTRELFEMILDQHPGHTPSLCKLGVVHLSLREPGAAADTFRRAVELDPQNPYAFRMLGFSLMQLGDLPGAEKAVRHAVELNPTDAKSHMLLATVCYRLDRAGEAESHFKGAISADPVPSEPYYNLALLCYRAKRFDEARQYYQQALERGAVPDPELEEKLAEPEKKLAEP